MEIAIETKAEAEKRWQVNFLEPWQLGLPHDKWRPYQHEAYQTARKALQEDDVVIVEAPVGIGKTAIAGALSDGVTTTVCVQNLGLLDQYQDYGFKVLKGRNSYPCVLESKVEEWVSAGKIPTAGDCHYNPMTSCPVASKCPYIEARNEALQAPRMACTYKYAVMSEKVHGRDGLIIMDEIHNAVKEFLSVDTFAMNSYERNKHHLPDFPLFEFGPGGKGDVLKDVDRYEVLGWLGKAMAEVSQINLFDELTPMGADKRKIFDRLQSLQELLVSGEELFYKCALEDGWKFNQKYGRPAQEPAMEVKVLSPKSVYEKAVSGKEKVFMMSATIGDPTALICGEFGISRWQYHAFPHPVPPEKRPVYKIGNYALTHANLVRTPALYQKQAQDIANWINTNMEEDYRGIILTTSNMKIAKLREHLRGALKNRRTLFSSFDGSTGLQERIESFKDDKTPGVVHVDTIQGWGTGVDLRGDTGRFSIVAGVPMSNPADRFDSIRFDTTTGRAYAYAFAYNSVMQATGRVTRGDRDKNGDYEINYSALADSMATAPLAMRFYSKWFKEAMVK